jgi:hypothetical protein
VLINSASTQAICSVGWAHKGSLWVYKLGEDCPRLYKLSDAKFLTIKAGEKDFFSVVHHWEDNRVEISAHHHLDPEQPISSISVRCTETDAGTSEIAVQGDTSVWRELPRAYVAFTSGSFRLFLVDCGGGVSIQKFDWYDHSTYDKGYQGVVGVEEVPDSSLLIVSIQRDSNPVLYDPGTSKLVRKLSLAGRLGNPRFQYRASANELWTDDYDHIVKLDAKSLNVIASKRLQGGSEVSRQFIGEFVFCRGERLSLVARPFSGDVIGLDCDSLQQTHRSTLGKQPLLAGLLGDDTVVALDWKTGEFLSGLLEKT